ncbi:MAG: hypothetical protein ABI772_10955 [Bacteroidota bacterium]
MRSKIKFALAILLFTFAGKSFAQVTIQNVGFNGDDVSSTCITNASLFNAGVEFSASMEIVIYDASRIDLMKVTTKPVLIKKGMNNFSRMSLAVQNVVYGNSDAAGFIKTFHRLSSGNYICCLRLINSTNPELTDGAEYCDEISVEKDLSMSLVSPFDDDIIETNHPVLVWTHNEPFANNTGAEDYRIVVTQMHEGQNAEAAMAANPLLFSKNALTSHSVIYPVNAPDLEKGKSYCWQVTKSINGRVVNQTEVWKFTLSDEPDTKDYKYGELSTTLSSSFYTSNNGKVFFRFREAYNSSGKLEIKIKDKFNKEVSVLAKNQKSNDLALNYKSNGSNAYEINVDELHLKDGFYLLEVFNEKKEKYLLKFKVE